MKAPDPAPKTAPDLSGGTWRDLIHVSDMFRVVATRSAESDKFNRVSVNQARIFGYLMKRSLDSTPVRVKDVARELDVSDAAASQAIDRLVRAGVVSRTPDPDDRRAVRLSFTEKGLAEIKKHERQAVALLDSLGGLFPEGDFATFRRVLSGVIDELQRRWAEIVAEKSRSGK